MDDALVIGADTPLGQATVRRLIALGYRVHGFGRDFSQLGDDLTGFHPVPVDPTDLSALTATAQAVLDTSGRLQVLVHAGRLAAGELPDDAPAAGRVEAGLAVQVEAPIVLTELLLPALEALQGTVLFIDTGRVEGVPETVRPAVSGALSGYARGLFAHGRSRGLRVTRMVLSPENESRGGADSPAGVHQYRINPEAVADAVEAVLNMPDGNLVSELLIRPQTGPADRPLPRTRIAIDSYKHIALPPVPLRTEPPTPVIIQAAPPPVVVRPDEKEGDQAEDEPTEAEEAALEKQAWAQFREAHGDITGSSGGGRGDSAEGGETSGRKRRGRRRRGGRNRSRTGDHEPTSEKPNQPSEPERPTDTRDEPEPARTEQTVEATSAPPESASEEKTNDQQGGASTPEGSADAKEDSGSRADQGGKAPVRKKPARKTPTRKQPARKKAATRKKAPAKKKTATKKKAPARKKADPGNAGDSA